MKQLFILLLASIFSVTIAAQGKSQEKSKGKDKTTPATVSNDKSKAKAKDNKDVKDRSAHEKKIWDGTYVSVADGPKPSKNQPAKVRAAFQRDYPNASNVYWSKYRGDWTATFRNGAWMSTAVYHANGDRRDTRTVVTREVTPKDILDQIFKRQPEAKVDDVVQIDLPKSVQKIYRIKSIMEGKTQYVYYNSDGTVTTYNY